MAPSERAKQVLSAARTDPAAAHLLAGGGVLRTGTQLQSILTCSSSIRASV